MKKHLAKSFKKILIVIILIMTIVNVFSVTPINEKTFAVTEPNIIKDGNTYYYVMSDGTKINYMSGFIKDPFSSSGVELGFVLNSADLLNYKKAEKELKDMGYDIYLDSKGNAKKLTAEPTVKKKGNDYYYVMKDGTEVKYVIDKNNYYFKDDSNSSIVVNGYVLSSDDKNYAAAKKELEDKGYSIYLDNNGNLQTLNNPTYSTTQKNTTDSTTQKNTTDSKDDGDSYFEKFINGAAGLFLYPLKILPLLLGKIIQAVMGIFTGNNKTLSIEDILFNKLDITKIDFFNMSTGNEVVDTIRKNVAAWYYSLRNISAVILIAILMYVGLRMALSTIADEKARYSEMIVNWVISIALLFVLHFIIELVIILNNQIVNILANNIDKSDPLDKIYKNAWSVGFVEGFGNAICYLVLVGMKLVFLLSYLKRMITVGFLIVIAPLVTITYSIDKMGDNKSQALDTWLKEFVYNILIQPFQCVTYIILAGSAMKILDNETSLAAMIVAIMMIVFIYESERIIRHIFHFEARTMAETVAQAALVGSTLGLFAKGGSKSSSLSSEEKDENQYKSDKEYAKMKKSSATTQSINSANTNETATGEINNASQNGTYTTARGKVASTNPHKKSRRVGNAISAVTNNKLFQDYANMAKTGSKMLLGGSFSLATGSPATFINTETKILKNGIKQKNDYIEERNKHQLQQAYQQAEEEARENMVNNLVMQKMNVKNLDDLDDEQKEQAARIKDNIEQTQGDEITKQAKGYVALRASQIVRGEEDPETEAEENMKNSIEKLRTYYTDNGMNEKYTNVQISEDLSDIRKGKYKESSHAEIEFNNKIKNFKDAGELAKQTGQIIATPITAPVNKVRKYYRKK